MWHEGPSLCHVGSFAAAHRLWLRCAGSVAAARGFCSSQASEILVSWPETELVSPALQGGLLTTGPPGKSSTCIFIEEIHFVIVVQLLSHGQLFATSRAAACQASLSFTVSQSLLKLMFIESVMSSNHLILCCMLLLLPSIFPRFSLFQ